MERVPEEAPAVKKKKTSAKKKAVKVKPAEEPEKSEDPKEPEGLKKTEEPKKSEEQPTKIPEGKKTGKAKKAGEKKKAAEPEDSKKELKAEELMNGVRQLMDEAKAKDSKLDVDEINDFFADYHLSPDYIEQIYAFL